MAYTDRTSTDDDYIIANYRVVTEQNSDINDNPVTEVLFTRAHRGPPSLRLRPPESPYSASYNG